MADNNSTVVPFPAHADGQGNEAHILGILLHGIESGQSIESVISSIKSFYPRVTDEKIRDSIIEVQDELRMQGKCSIPAARKVQSINHLITPLLNCGRANTFTEALLLLADDGNETARSLLSANE